MDQQATTSNTGNNITEVEGAIAESIVTTSATDTITDGSLENNENVETESAKTEPAAQEEPDPAFPKPVVVNKKLCGICKVKEAKYKCSRCALPFCSIACSTVHKVDHPATKTKEVTKPKAESKLPSNGTDPRPGTVAAAGFKGPFAALDESKELKALFKMYPRLPALLDEINSTTLPPTQSAHENRGPQRRKEEPWNTDLGLRKGVEALTKARNSDSKDAESLREYSKLVLQILSGENGQSAADLIQKELREENARIIERLLQGET